MKNLSLTWDEKIPQVLDNGNWNVTETQDVELSKKVMEFGVKFDSMFSRCFEDPWQMFYHICMLSLDYEAHLPEEDRTSVISFMQPIMIHEKGWTFF